MFNSLQEAVEFADSSKNKENDGGVPVFYKKAVAFRDGTEVDWKDEIWVKIFNKGDSKNIMERAMRNEDKERWPKHWQAYLNNEEPDIDGTPLAEFPNITPAEREKCKHLKLLSVEDLANYPDGQIQDLGSRGHALQKAAREFLDYKEGTTVKNLEARIAELEKMLNESNSTSDDSKRGAGNKPAKTVKSNKGRTRSKRKSVPASRDDSQEAG